MNLIILNKLNGLYEFNSLNKLNELIILNKINEIYKFNSLNKLNE